MNSYFLLILISLLPLGDLFHHGLFISHDGQDHVARIANFYQSLVEGNLVPRWAANLNWGYGHPILMFLYPLPSYFASFFHFLGFSFVDSTKIVFALGFILSGIFAYLWVKEFWGREAGFLAGIFYLFASYRFVDLYVRGAIGENFAFVWPPLICLFALKLSRKFRWHYLVGGSLSLAALILSHNALSLMFLPLIFGYMAYLVYQSNQKFLYTLYFILYTLYGFLLSAFFWFPAFFEGKYTLRSILLTGEFFRFRSLSEFFWSPWSYGGETQLSVQLGILQWLMVGLTPFLIYRFWKKKDKSWMLIGGLLAIFIVSLFLLTEYSLPVWRTVRIIQNFQFTWRFLSLAIFPPAVFAGALIYLLPKKFKLFAVSCLLLAVLFLNKTYWHAKDFSYKDESFYTGAYAGTTDTGESSPRWSVRFMEKFPKAPMEVIEGKAEVKEISRLTTEHIYQIDVKSPSRLVENTLYFPGWQVLVDGQPVLVEFQDPAHRGLMTFYIPEGEHRVVVRFGETKLRLFANVVSLVGMIGLVFGSIIKVRFYEKTQNFSSGCHF